MDTQGNRKIHKVIGGYTGLQVGTQGYRWIHRVTGGYIELNVDTQGNRWIHRVKCRSRHMVVCRAAQENGAGANVVSILTGTTVVIFTHP